MQNFYRETAKFGLFLLGVAGLLGGFFIFGWVAYIFMEGGMCLYKAGQL